MSSPVATPPRRTGPALVGFIGSAFVAGAIGSWATIANVRAWYPLINKPAWNPPNWLFAPVWTVLYVFMGVAIWRVWRRGPAARPLCTAYFLQLALNALWSVLFFGLKRPDWALADIVVLWGLLVWLQIALARRDRGAGALWLPYLLWVSFATALNWAIVRLN